MPDLRGGSTQAGAGSRGRRGTAAAVVFDGDDTLWHTELLYDRARTHSSQVVAGVGLDPSSFELLQKELDLRNFETYGLSPTRFPTSSVEAYRELAARHGLPVAADAADEIYRRSAGVFVAVAPLVEHVADVLGDLSQDHRLALLTKGDPEVQERRIEASGLAGFFELTRVVAEKDERCFVEVVVGLDCAPAASWSVGNSVPSDIAPALRAGMQAIWIDSPVWDRERSNGTVDVSPRLHRAKRLDEVPSIVRQHSARHLPA